MQEKRLNPLSVFAHCYFHLSLAIDQQKFSCKRHFFEMPAIEHSQRRICVILGIVGLFGIITFALSAATLGTLNKRFDALSASTIPNSTAKLGSALAESIRIDDLMYHLKQLQRIADESNGTRAINTRGFQETVNYIYNYLSEQIPDLQVTRETFLVPNVTLETAPILISSINGSNNNYTYSPVLARSQFTSVTYSTAANFSDFVRLVSIPSNGCAQSDWRNADGSVVLVKGGGKCTYGEKGLFATRYRARAILFYNDDQSNANLAPITVRLRASNQLPALFLSNDVGQALLNATLTTNVTVRLIIRLRDLGSFPVENICAHTKTGDPNQTIVVGSHSDSVPAGPGINDNGKSPHLERLAHVDPLIA